MQPRRDPKRLRSVGWVAAFGLAAAVALGGCDEDAAPAEDAGVDALVQQDAEVTADASPDAAPDPYELDPQRIWDDVAWLSHDDREGRAPPGPGNVAAMDYIETLFTDLGLEPAGDNGTYRQGFMFDYWAQQGASDVEVDGVSYEAGTDYVVMSYSGSASVIEEVVFVGYGLTIPAFNPVDHPNCPVDPAGYDDYAGVDVTGKVALILRHGPGDDQDIYDNCPANAACAGAPCLWNFGYKTANAELHGAAAAIIVQDYRHAADDVIYGNIGAEYFQTAVAGIFADRGPVQAALPDLETWADTIDASTMPHSVETGVMARIVVGAGVETVQTENVLGKVVGTHPLVADEVVIVSGHLDHIGVDVDTGEINNGADDNASGTAVMMEMARAVAHPTFESARTVLFAAWNAEELGLVGSCYYVDNPTLPLADTVAMFSVDMVGAGNGTGVQVWGTTYQPFAWLQDVVEGASADAGLSYQIVGADPIDLSDHACFASVGVTAVMIDTLGQHAYYHTPADTIDTILPADLEAAASVMWATLENLALGLEELHTGGSPKPADAQAPPRPLAIQRFLRTR